MTDKYIEAEKRLAALRGFFDIEEAKLHGYLQMFVGRWGAYETRRQHIPRWTRDNAEAFALMVEHGVQLTFNLWMVAASACDGSMTHSTLAAFTDHPDKETAVRYAIVMAVIAKLEAQHAQR